MPNEMTFQQEGDYIVCYIDGVEVSRAKKAADGTSTAEVIDIINDQIKANPTLSGTEPNLEGLEVSGDKYAVPQGGGGGSSLLSDIVDTNGNYRFVEGDGIPDTTNITSSYCKWSLSGTHLMIVLAGKYIVNNVADQTVLAQYEVPEFILNKIFPVWGDNIEMKQVFARLEAGTGYEDWFKFVKENGKLKILQQGQYNHNDTYFRIQFDLLIDSE